MVDQLDAAFLLETIKALQRLEPVVYSARAMMVQLGLGDRDVSGTLAEIHNALRALDGKDYLAHRSSVIS